MERETVLMVLTKFRRLVPQNQRLKFKDCAEIENFSVTMAVVFMILILVIIEPIAMMSRTKNSNFVHQDDARIPIDNFSGKLNMNLNFYVLPQNDYLNANK